MEGCSSWTEVVANYKEGRRVWLFASKRRLDELFEDYNYQTFSWWIHEDFVSTMKLRTNRLQARLYVRDGVAVYPTCSAEVFVLVKKMFPEDLHFALGPLRGPSAKEK